MRSSVLVATALLFASSHAFSLAARRSWRRPARVCVRVAYPVAASPYEPQKGRPKKSKQKAPKQKVKGPVSASLPEPEKVFFEGAPSKSELIIPGASIITVVGLIPFSAAVARQAWTRYKLTTRRIEVASGFQGKDVVQATWREVADVKWLRRFGGVAGDMVFTLSDGAKLELRSIPEFDRNLAFVMTQVAEDVPGSSGVPDGPAKEFAEKLARGDEPPLAGSDAARATAP